MTEEEIPQEPIAEVEEEEIPEETSTREKIAPRGGQPYREKNKVPMTHGYWKTCQDCGGTGKDPRDPFGLPCTMCLGKKQYFVIPAVEA